VNLYTPTKWVAMQDDAGCLVPQDFMCSSVGARIMPASSVSEPANRIRPAISGLLDIGNARTESYLPDGRRLNVGALPKSAGQGFHGVVFSRAQGEQAGALRTVLVP
jgi:hypothetical protein